MNQRDFNKKFIESIRSEASDTELLAQMKPFIKLPSGRALLVYQEDYQARLTEALKNTFRSVHTVVGDDAFFSLSLSYLEIYPSTFSDLDDYGDQFPIFLQTHPLLQDYPFLSDLAYFEWMFRFIFHSKETIGMSAMDLGSLLADEAQKFQLVPSVALLTYPFAIEKIFSACHTESEEPFDYHASEHILMFKKNDFVKMHLLSMNQLEAVKIFQSPSSFSNCIKNAPATMTPEEMQTLFTIIGSEQILLKS